MYSISLEEYYSTYIGKPKSLVEHENPYKQI